MLKFRIKELLEEKGKTRYWLVKQLNSSYPAVDNIIDNTAFSVRIETLEKLMKVFDCEIQDLFTTEG
ncbi:helix-turn-helix transcriptional regulator [Clostridia bacterium OttesenSCG-928-F22]|nr:helix-turn-helix transcriptional regulator [Clostridia bacterium OttesenSCG-928-F22]